MVRFGVVGLVITHSKWFHPTAWCPSSRSFLTPWWSSYKKVTTSSHRSAAGNIFSLCFAPGVGKIFGESIQP